MNERYDKIISEYRDADFDRRLSLYLQFPPLRSEFILIDQNELNTDLSKSYKLRGNSLVNHLNEVLRAAAGYAKKILGVASA